MPKPALVCSQASASKSSHSAWVSLPLRFAAVRHRPPGGDSQAENGSSIPDCARCSLRPSRPVGPRRWVTYGSRPVCRGHPKLRSLCSRPRRGRWGCALIMPRSSPAGAHACVRSPPARALAPETCRTAASRRPNSRPNNWVLGCRRRAHHGPGINPDQASEQPKRESLPQPDTAADGPSYTFNPKVAGSRPARPTVFVQFNGLYGDGLPVG